ncbi:muramidase (flagellum-specific) [Bernardetia litoralis DSM 6794]|uniref:Muramidase (Flagellum-specific) n=1 Tax=Bernardetia litoralis (strain ATCC 23117 / DSM 6794 / NBRC 15988 / NCIMB 1366 / Fx l1 / Sio-4) TaxID=880071 RepID=I4AQ97_BERLS|nr:glucosaminidase domain-containing protein [Bernardetia litoralis]AFM06132.1 muramidase (flagellum-specific) [Bernardetia litoralis DSM 6794]
MLPIPFKKWVTRPVYSISITIPTSFKNNKPVLTFSIQLNNRLILALIGIFSIIAVLQVSILVSGKDDTQLAQTNTSTENTTKEYLEGDGLENNNTDNETLDSDEVEYNDVLDYGFKHLSKSNPISKTETEDKRKNFLKIKHTLISEALIENQVSRLEQLSDAKMILLNQKLSEAFITIVFNQTKVEPHVMAYFTGTKDLKKFETALMEQAKYHVPASIKLAQSALETAYGQRIVNNNYFGIKDKRGKTKAITTTEYYTAAEYKANKNKVVSSKIIQKGGKTLYKCLIKDSFADYHSPWESFRAHSIFLNESKRYSPLFTKGKNYEDWADKIGSTKYGGVGYATSPIYGELLKKIIKRYNLDLLDY